MGDKGQGWTPLLAESRTALEVFLPIRATARIKYTSLDISKRYLVFGASSGGIYIFHRDSLKFLQVLANKDGAISQVSLAPDDNVLGYSTSKGLVVVLEHNVERRGSHHTPRRLHVSYEHKGASVTSVRWNSASSRLFIGDDRGRVSVINVLTSKAKILFQVPTVVIMRLDSRVVQLDFAQDKLVASTLSRCYLCDTVEEQYTQIGKKTRDGEFGACFFSGGRVQTPSIYATRPGSRVWEVDFSGTVLNTHQFKEALAVPPQPITVFGRDFRIPSLDAFPPQNLNFGRILPLSDKYLITWTDSGVYLLDPVNAAVVLWTNEITRVREIRSYKSEFYAWLLDGSLRIVSVVAPEKLVSQLYATGDWLLCAQVALHHEGAVLSGRRHVTSSMLHTLASHLCEDWASDAGAEEVASVRRLLASRVDALAVKAEEVDCASMSSSHSGRSSSTDSYSMRHDGYGVRHSDSEDERPIRRVHYASGVIVSGSSRGRPRSATPHSSGPSAYPVSFRPISPSTSKVRSKSSSPTVVVTRAPSLESTTAQPHQRPASGSRLMTSSTIVDNERPTRSHHDARMTQSMTVIERRRAILDDAGGLSPNRDTALKRVPTPPKKRTTCTLHNVPSNALETKQYTGDNLPRDDATDCSSSAFRKIHRIHNAKPIRLKSPTRRAASPSSVTSSTPTKVEVDEITNKDDSNDVAEAKEALPVSRRKYKLQATTLSRPAPAIITKKPELRGVSVPQLRKSFSSDLVNGLENHTPAPAPPPKPKPAKAPVPPVPSKSVLRSTQSMEFPKDACKPKRAAPEITLAFPYSPFLGQYGFSDSSFTDAAYSMGSTFATVTLTPPGNLLDLKDSLASSLQQSKEKLRQSIASVEERLSQRQDSDGPPELLDVRQSGAGTRDESSLVQQLQRSVEEERYSTGEPIVMRVSNGNATKRELNDKREAAAATPTQRYLQMRIFRKGEHSTLLPKSDVASKLVALSLDTKREIDLLATDASEVDDVVTTRNEMLRCWLTVLYDIHKEVLGNIRDAVLLKLGEEASRPKSGPMAKRQTLLEVVEKRLNSLFFIDDPFDLSKDDHLVVSSLAELCFESKIFDASTVVGRTKMAEDGTASTDVSTEESQMLSRDDNAFPEGPHTLWQLAASVSDISRIDEAVDYEQWLESVRSLSCLPFHPDSQASDKQGAEFVRQFFHLLDAEKCLRSLTCGYWHHKPRFHTWTRVVSGVQETLTEDKDFLAAASATALDSTLVSKWPKTRLVALLKRWMSSGNSSAAVDLAARCHPHISAADAVLLCRQSDSPAHWFELYLSRVVSASAAGTGSWSCFQIPTVIGQLEESGDDEVKTLWAALLLAKGSTFRELLKCYCGCPRPWAHQAPWPHSAILWQLVKKASRWKDVLAVWCYICGYWPGFLHHCNSDSPTNQTKVEIVVQLGDINLVDADAECGFFPKTEAEWQLLLSLVAKQQQTPGVLRCLVCEAVLWKMAPIPSSPTTTETVKMAATVTTTTIATASTATSAAAKATSPSNCRPPTLTWSNLCRVLVHQKGVVEAVAVLRSVEGSLPPGCFSPPCLRTLLLASVARMMPRSPSQQKILPNEKFVWRRDPKVLGPELYHLYRAEKQQASAAGDVAVSTTTASIFSLSSALSASGRMREEGLCHWGSTLRLHSDCFACGLPLTLGTSALVQGIVLLDCGHAYHQSCAEKGSCSLCQTVGQ